VLLQWIGKRLSGAGDDAIESCPVLPMGWILLLLRSGPAGVGPGADAMGETLGKRRSEPERRSLRNNKFADRLLGLKLY
jgi:hypothetical protein